MDAPATGRTVSLTIPAKPDYVVLARLALSAVCRLAPLAPEDVADLKLAITESATYLMGGHSSSGDQLSVSFTYALGDTALEILVSGEERQGVSEEERELSLALIKATVDGYAYADGVLRLEKKLEQPAE